MESGKESMKKRHKRWLGWLKTPHPANDRELIYKIVVDEIRNGGTFVYLYLAPDAVRSSYDEYYFNTEDAMEGWQNEIDEQGWIPLPEPPEAAYDLIFRE